MGSFPELIQSFKKVCNNLVKQAEFDLRQIEDECKEEFNASAKIINDFDLLISGMGKTTSELLNTYEISKMATSRAVEGNVFHMPFEIQLATVKCINDLYNLKPVERRSDELKLIDESKMELLDQVLKKE